MNLKIHNIKKKRKEKKREFNASLQLESEIYDLLWRVWNLWHHPDCWDGGQDPKKKSVSNKFR